MRRKVLAEDANEAASTCMEPNTLREKVWIIRNPIGIWLRNQVSLQSPGRRVPEPPCHIPSIAR
ncbi:hypothetical protein [Brevundimonas pondensis]|jgi:hypothetical protein|uniref:hypothetical protein n=1 Tax=Brevundimonas pondensis TaxID=2774189 RepID=UPI001A9EE409|nr:hypothetical protein [Brevundimonas pondensis]